MAQPQKPTLSGFDIKKLAAAARPVANDPWARREQWRYTGPFTRANRFRNTFPGFGIATGAFVVYCVAERFLFPQDHSHGHADDHGDGHH